MYVCVRCLVLLCVALRSFCVFRSGPKGPNHGTDAYELATSKYEKTMWYYHPATIGSHTTFLMRSSPARSAVNKLHVPSGTGEASLMAWEAHGTSYMRSCLPVDGARDRRVAAVRGREGSPSTPRAPHEDCTNVRAVGTARASPRAAHAKWTDATRACVAAAPIQRYTRKLG